MNRWFDDISTNKDRQNDGDNNHELIRNESRYAVRIQVATHDSEDSGRSSGSFFQTMDHVVDGEPGCRKLFSVCQVLDAPDVGFGEGKVSRKAFALAVINRDHVDGDPVDLPVIVLQDPIKTH